MAISARRRPGLTLLKRPGTVTSRPSRRSPARAPRGSAWGEARRDARRHTRREDRRPAGRPARHGSGGGLGRPGGGRRGRWLNQRRSRRQRWRGGRLGWNWRRRNGHGRICSRRLGGGGGRGRRGGRGRHARRRCRRGRRSVGGGRLRRCRWLLSWRTGWRDSRGARRARGRGPSSDDGNVSLGGWRQRPRGWCRSTRCQEEESKRIKREGRDTNREQTHGHGMLRGREALVPFSDAVTTVRRRDRPGLVASWLLSR
jgi:hypothetical protein